MSREDFSVSSTGPRGQIERLLRGNVKPSDLHDLFFNLRDGSGVDGFVCEVANFIAHPNLRTQGPTWREVRDSIAFIRLHSVLKSSAIITRDVPDFMPEALRGNFRRIRKSRFERETGVKYRNANQILERVLARCVRTGPGRVSGIVTRNDEEFRVMNFVARHLKGGSLFNEHDLMEDLFRSLERQNLVNSKEKPLLKRQRNAISLYALTAMHNKKLDLGDNTKSTVTIARDMRGNLGAFAFSEFPNLPQHGKISVGFWVFETSMLVQDFCEMDVAPPDRSPFIGDFELKPSNKLGRRI